ncbi:MAG TPA: ABC transporter ATP-binding protein [Actinocrinis sp.]|nr:ABC transporter ATP-binding protein [Actinocrinis sp.]
MTTTATTALSVHGLVRRYGGNAAVDQVDVTVESHQITALVGPNGAGKTTLFHCIAGIEPADAGRVTLAGKDISDLAPHRRVRAGLAWTFQRVEVFATMTVAENITVGAEQRRSTNHDTDDLVNTLIARLGLDDVRDTTTGELPTGTLRLVELGRALATAPSVLLLDEPAGGLDDAQILAFAKLLPQLVEEGMAVVLIEHDMDLVARIADQIYVMDRGRVIAHGSLAQLRQDARVRELFPDSPFATATRT